MSNGIDWEQRRYEIAKDAVNGFLCRNNNLPFYEDKEGTIKEVVVYSIALADALIEELKKDN